MPARRRGLAALALPLVTVLGWGGLFPVAKVVLPTVNAFYLSTERYALASLIFIVALFLVEGRAALRFDGHIRRAFLLGSVGFAGYNLLVFVGLAHTRPQNAALLIATMPLLTLLVLWARRGVRPTAPTLTFMFPALLGVGLVITRGSPSSLSAGQGGMGDLMILLGVLLWVIYTLGASSLPEWSPLRYTTLTAMTGTVTIVAATAVATALGYVHAPGLHATIGAAWEIAYLVLPGTVVAVLAWNAGIKALGPQNTVLFINLVPIITLAIEIGRGYQLTRLELGGVMLTLGAVTGNNLWQRRVSRRIVSEQRMAA
ncbi:MAG: DMT family transporter [Chloroflexota bacterium]